MSAAVDFARHNFGRHILVDGMARPHHGYHDSHAHGHGQYPQDQQFRQPPQTARLPRLPPMATIQAVTSSPSPVLPDGRDAPYYGAKSTYYSDYATPSPVGQTPPQFPVPSSDSHPVSRRAVDMGRSPTLSSTASDRSSDEIGQELRLRQMGSLHDPSGQGQAPHLYVHQQPPRLRGDTLQRDGAFPPVPGEAAPYSSSVIPNGQSGPPQLPRSPPSTQPSASPRQETKSMSISNLLSSDTTSNNKTIATSHPSSSPTAAAAATAATQPTPTATAARSPTSEYRITVRQQPLAARSCGFGERDRRVIDPPPIVQLTIHDEALSRDELGRRLRHQFSVVHCSIWDDAGARDMGGMPDDFRQQRRLMGTLVASPFVGADERGDEGCFFCFPDLSCRTPGAFRLKFALVVLDPARMHTGDRSAIVATAMSEPFHVYNAKDFPGMQASTPLTKRLKEQGCLISIKKGNEKREASGGAQGMGEDDEDDEEEEEEEGKSGGAVGGGGGGGGGRSSSAAEGKGRVRKRVKR